MVMAAVLIPASAVVGSPAGTSPADAVPESALLTTATEPAHRDAFIAERKVRLVVSRTARRGNASFRVPAGRQDRVKVRGERRVAHGSPRGTRHAVRAWVRSRQGGQRVRLVVLEKRRGVSTQRRRSTISLPRGRWTRVSVPVRTRHRNSRLAVRMRIRNARGRGAVRVNRTVIARPRPSRSCRISARGVPGCGTYLGMAYGSNSDPAGLERRLGGTIGVRRTYFTADKVDSAVRIARQDLAAGRLPWISFKLPASWDRMAAGAGDAWARSLTARLAKLPGPVWVAFHHEPEHDGDITDWRRMQERLGPIVRKAPNVGFTVVVTGWHQFYGESEFHLDSMWPRGTKVDVAGFDIYNQLGVVKDGSVNTKGTDLRTAYFKKIAAWAEREGVAWGLAETGYTHKAAELDPLWLTRTYGEMEAMGGVAFAYFNTTLNSIAPWDLSTEPKLKDFERALTGTAQLPSS